VHFRLNRDHCFTQCNKISFKELEQIDKNPILYNLPILESVFYNGVVLCEGDSDRMFYQKVMDKIASDYDDKILFINTYGKHTMKNVIPFIKSSHIPFKLIVDFDLLLSGGEFDKIIKELTTEKNCTKMISKRKKFSQIITGYGTEGEGEGELQKHIFQKLIRLLNKKSERKNNTDLTKHKKNIENFSRKSKVDRIKKNG
jgi:predicted ATP-dependent endonuclease of OLD family